VRSNAEGLADRFTTLAETLQANGYETAAFSSMPTILTRGGLGQGFDVSNSESAGSGEFLLDGEDVNRLALSWLEETNPAPFLLWLHYSETHSPYRLTSDVRNRFEETRYEGPLSQGATTEVFYSLGRDIPWSAEERQALRSLYEGEAEQLDRLIGEMMERARHLGLLEDTVIIITADHGQALGEHDKVGHGFLLWQPVVHVPLMIRFPDDRIDPPHRISTRVSLIDLPPTILEMLDLVPSAPADGRSLMPALLGGLLPSLPYYVEARGLEKDSLRTERDAAAVAVFLDDSKAIWRSGEFEVYDLGDDPLEMGGRDSSMPEGRSAELLRLAIEYHDLAVMLGPNGKIDEDVDEELRALGYIE
jgi:arylsulfatase A-like enzyme